MASIESDDRRAPGAFGQLDEGKAMKVVIAAALAVACASVLAQGSHSTKGYVKKSGTYVAPSYATNPNATKGDNYSSKGNVNPYTGKAGTKNPYAAPAPKKSKH